jgi:hypothetical protein
VFRYSLRTLLILTILEPAMLAWIWFGYLDYIERQRVAADREIELILAQLLYNVESRTVIRYDGSILMDLPIEIREQALRELSSDFCQLSEIRCVD